MAETEDIRCSFCAKTKSETRKLIAGPLVFICNECVDVCLDIIKDDERFEAQRHSPQVSGPPHVPHTLPMPGLMDHVAELSPQDQWLLVMHILARLRDRHLGA